MKTLFGILLTLLASASQAVTLEALQKQFGEQTVVRARFEQVRHIEGIPQPLKSNGEFLISRDHGLWWQQQRPFAMTLILDDRRMVLTTLAQPPQVVTAEDNPQMFQFNHLLRSLFKADYTALQQNFALDFSDTGNGRWQLILTPKTSPLDKLFDTITLKGDVYLNGITIDDRQGDRTEIRFFDHSTDPGFLSEAEILRFAE